MRQRDFSLSGASDLLQMIWTLCSRETASCHIPIPEFPSLQHMALFLDFDGTLAPLQDHADQVTLRDDIRAALINLQAQLGHGPVLISGRDLDDLSARTPQALIRIGNHGLRRASSGQGSAPRPAELPENLRETLDTILQSHPGCFAEDKASIVAIHYRAAPESKESLETALRTLPLSGHGYHLEAGKMIFELKPDGASKGAALAEEMHAHPDLIPVMIGDDTTDEAAMAAAQELGGIGVKVGAGKTCANIRLNSVEDVHALLKDWARVKDEV